MIDIGGGSTELIVGTGDEIAFHASLQAGVVRHTERHIASDPPTAIELEALAGDVRGLIEEPRPHTAGATAGRGDRRRRHPDLAGRDRDGARALRPGAGPRPRALPAGDPADALPARLGAARASAGEIPGLHPDRAPTIVAGVVILIEAMRAFGLDEIEVSEHDILYGAAIDAASRATR